MRPLAVLVRLLVALLLLRMVAAPVAVRPTPITSASTLRVIVRICAWPAQRSERQSQATALAFGSGGSGSPLAVTYDLRRGMSALMSLTPLEAAKLDAAAGRCAFNRRIADSPRC